MFTPAQSKLVKPSVDRSSNVCRVMSCCAPAPRYASRVPETQLKASPSSEQTTTRAHAMSPEGARAT
jgi:hypothetical protein